MMPRTLDLFVELSWKCACTGCDQVARLGFMAPVDGPFGIDPPAGWTIAQGRIYCYRHKVELTVTPRGAQIIEFPLQKI